MNEPRAAAIYARISSDQEGTALGVKRQLQDCRHLAQNLGWTVAEEYVDNDVSAYSGKHRPAYARMVDDIADGARDGLIVYHHDRLTRRPIELEQFLTVATAARLNDVRFVSGGDLDVGNGDGLLVVRLLVAVAAAESATKSRRMKRKYEEIAAKGLPHGNGSRAFGYEADMMTINPVEADILRTLVDRYLAGESARSLTMWLDEQGVPTVMGGAWNSTTVRGMLESPRHAGLREHRGQVVGPAAWPAIITEDKHSQVLARMAQRAHSGRRRPRSYLLSGMLRCGKCSKTLFSSRRETTRRYVCMKGPDQRGCGGIMVVAGPLEQLITDAVLYRLDTPELADALAGRARADEATAVLSEQLSADREQLEELASLYAQRTITAREWMAARNPIEARIQDAARRVSRATDSAAVAGFVGNGDALRAQWAGLNLDRQHAIVGAVLDHAVIGPGIAGARRFNPDRVSPLWRL